MAEGNDSIYFSVAIDNEQLQKEAEQAASLLGSIGTAAEGAGKRMDSAIDESAKSINDLSNKLNQLQHASTDIGKLESVFEAQASGAKVAQEAINDMVEQAKSGVSSAAALKDEIQKLTTEMNASDRSQLSDDKRAVVLDVIKDKIAGYRETVEQTTAQTRAAYALEGEQVLALQQAIAQLEVAKTQAAAGGTPYAISVIQQQITTLKTQLAGASANLAQYKTAVEQADAALADLDKTQASLTASAERGRSFFGNIIDNAQDARNKVGELVDTLRDKASTALEPIKNKASEVSSVINEKFSNLSQKIGLDRLGEAISTAGNKLIEYKNKVVDAATGHGKFQESIGNFKTALNGLPMPLGNVITSIGGMTKALWDMCKTPVGAVLAAIAAGLQLVYQFFTKSAEGQRAYAKITAYVGSVMSSITDIAITLGKWLYHAFADASGPMNKFGKGMVTTFKSAIKTVADLFSGLGTTIRGVFEMDWDTIKQGLSQIGKGLKEGVQTALLAIDTQIKGVVGAVSTIKAAFTDKELSATLSKQFGDIERKAKSAAIYAEREANANMQMAKAKEDAARIDIEIAKKRDEIYKLTGKEREEMAKEVKLLMQQKFDGQIKAQRELTSLIGEKNALHTKSLEHLKQEREARIQLYQLEAQQITSQRMMTRLEASAARSAETAEGKAAKKAAQNAKKDVNQSNAITAADEAVEKAQQANALKRANAAYALEQSITDATIAGIKDGVERTKAERERQHQKELEQIEQQKKEAIAAEIALQRDEFDKEQAAIKARGGRTRAFTDADIDTGEIEKITAQYEKLSELKHEAYTRAEQDRENESMNEYLKQYGTYEEKRLAITQEYSKKIAQAQTVGERMTLTAQMDDELRKLEKTLGNGINWEGMFSNIESYSLEYLKKLKKQLKDELSKGDIMPDQAEALGQQLDKVNEQIRQRQNAWKDMFSLGIPEIERINQLQEDAAEAAAQNEQAQEEYNNKLREELMLREQIARYINEKTGSNLKADDIDASTMQQYSQQFGGSDNTFTSLLDKFSKSKQATEISKQAAAQAATKATTTQAAAEGATSGAGGAAAGFAATDAIIHGVNQNLQSVSKMIDEFKLDGTKFGKGMKTFAQSSQYATDAFDSLKQGDIAGVVLNLNSAFGTLGNSLSQWGIGGGLFGESDVTLAEDIERLTAVNKELTAAISNLAEIMDKTAVANATDVYQQQKEDIEASMRNTQEMMARSAASYTNGFLGVGGHHSTNSKIDSGLSATDWQRVSKSAGVSVSSAVEFFNLTSEQMANVRNYATDLYSKIKDLADDGYANAAQFMDTYTEYYKQLEEINDSWREKLTSTSFDDVKDDFKSALKDMESSTADFAENLNDMLTEAALEGMLSASGGYYDQLQEWYKSFAEYMKDGVLDATEAAISKDAYNAIVENAAEQWKSMRSTLGLDSSAYTQDSTKSTLSGLTQDQGTAIEGRLTGIQSAVYQIQIAHEQSMVNSTLIASSVGDMRNTMDDMLELQTQGIDHLARIARYTAELPQMREDLQKIRQYTDNA